MYCLLGSLATAVRLKKKQHRSLFVIYLVSLQRMKENNDHPADPSLSLINHDWKPKHQDQLLIAQEIHHLLLAAFIIHSAQSLGVFPGRAEAVGAGLCT